jgi:hypothetical protein
MKFKGEEGFALFGLFAGIAGAAIFIGIKSFDEQIPYPVTLSVNIGIVAMFLLSMVIKFSSIFTHHAVFTINADDFILGSALGFDIPLVVSQLIAGHLPFVE